MKTEIIFATNLIRYVVNFHWK